MIRQFMSDEEQPEGVRITTLTGCLRQACLQSRFDFYYPVETLWSFLRGRIGHLMIENGHAPEDNSIAERRFYKDINGITVSGKPDLLLPNIPEIVDFKSTDSIPLHPHTGHIAQLNFYRLLVSGTFPQFQHDTRKSLLYFTMGKRSRSYVPMWSLRETEEELNNRLALYIEGRVNGWLPDPLPKHERILCGWCSMPGPCIEALGEATSLPSVGRIKRGVKVKIGGIVAPVSDIIEDQIGRRWCILVERPYLVERLSVV